MNESVDFNRFWGTRLSDVHVDCKTMSLTFDLFWTVDARSFETRLCFKGVSKCDFAADKIFESEVVELISLEGKKVNGGLRVVGEFSNYEFTILCKEVCEKVPGEKVSGTINPHP